jgi:nucleotide-binding universal stress UspA family protein
VIAPQIPASIDFGAYVPLPPPSQEEVRREHAELVRKLHELAPRELAERGIETQIELVTAFSTAEVIARAADRLESDVIVMPTHGRSGLSKALLGSVAQGVVRHANVPVLIVPPTRA